MCSPCPPCGPPCCGPPCCGPCAPCPSCCGPCGPCGPKGQVGPCAGCGPCVPCGPCGPCGPCPSCSPCGVPCKDGTNPGPCLLCPACIKVTDMTEEMQRDATCTAQCALAMYTVEKDIASYIKKDYDKRFCPSWHCFVGKNYGSYVSHETTTFIYFFIGELAFVLYKCGWSLKGCRPWGQWVQQLNYFKCTFNIFSFL